MKYLLLILTALSFNLYSQSNELFHIMGIYKNIEYPVKTQLIFIPDEGEALIIDQQFGLRYSYYLEQKKNYQIRFIYSPNLIKTISIIPENGGDYVLNVDFNLREKIHCLLMFEENETYGMYLLTDKEQSDIINARNVADE